MTSVLQRSEKVIWFFACFPISYRDPEEIMEKRSMSVDHATLNRWVDKYEPLIARDAQKQKAPYLSLMEDEQDVCVGEGSVGVLGLHRRQTRTNP